MDSASAGHIAAGFAATWAAGAVLAAVVWPWARAAGFGAGAGWAASRAAGPAVLALATVHVGRWGGVAMPGAARVAAGAMATATVTLVVARAVRLSGAAVVAGRRRALREVVAVESVLVALALAIGWLAAARFGGVRAYGERPLDLGLVTSLSDTRWFPPEDFWCAGRPLHYYYLGALGVAATHGALGGLAPLGAYFAALAWGPALAGGAAWAAARRMGGRGGAAWLSAVAATAAGSGGPVWRWARDGIVPWSPEAPAAAAAIIPGTTNETPALAWWLAESHAHTQALGPLLLFAGLAGGMAVEAGGLKVRGAARRTGASVARWGALAVLGAAVALTDVWMAPPAVALAAVFALAAIMGRGPVLAVPSPAGGWGWWLRGAAMVGVTAVVAAALTTPLTVGFQGYPARLRAVASGGGSAPMQLSVLFGPVAVVAAAAWLAGRRPQGGDCAAGRLSRRRRTGRVAGSLMGVAVALVAGCEFLYVDNGFVGPSARFNTVFRFHYAAYAFAGLAAGVAMGRWPRRGARRRAAAWCAAAVAGAACAFTIAPVALAAVAPAPGARWGVDPRVGMDPGAAGYTEAAGWLRINTRPGDRLLESAGRPYSGFGTVAAMSGRPAPLGETASARNHGATADDIATRLAEAAEVYAAGPAAGAVLERRGIRHIVLGPAEAAAFPGLNAAGLRGRHRLVFRHGAVEVLAVDGAATRPQR